MAERGKSERKHLVRGVGASETHEFVCFILRT